MISLLQLYRINRTYQYLYSVGAVLLVAGICFIFSSLINYHIVAFLLLVTVSLAAVVFLSVRIRVHVHPPSHFWVLIARIESSTYSANFPPGDLVVPLHD